MTTKTGWKDDGGKLRMELLPPELLTGTAAVLTFGAAKYGDRNWERGLHWSRVYAALQRHLWAWWGGEETDAETGMSHLWHASCCMAFLISYEARRAGSDDRPHQMVNQHFSEMLTGDLDADLNGTPDISAAMAAKPVDNLDAGFDTSASDAFVEAETLRLESEMSVVEVKEAAE